MSQPDFTFIENVELYLPEYGGKGSILMSGNRVLRCGSGDVFDLRKSGFQVDWVDGAKFYALPGFVDPHEHLVGGSGENGGFASQTPEVGLMELIYGGVTTVVGCLGTDSMTKTMPALLAKVKGLNDEGISAYLYSGGYTVPATTLTGSVGRDLLLCSEVIGAGEIAIADCRSCQPATSQLATLVSDAYVGGLLSGKAGITHFHVGPGERRLAQLRELLTNYDILPESIYPTHVERTEALLAEAAELSRRGSAVDVDSIDGDVGKAYKIYLANGGVPHKFSVSSDAGAVGPEAMLQEFRNCVLKDGFGIAEVLPIFTANAANTLKLAKKGRISTLHDADIILVDRQSLALEWVFAKGKALMRAGRAVIKPRFLKDCSRRIEIYGEREKN